MPEWLLVLSIMAGIITPLAAIMFGIHSSSMRSREKMIAGWQTRMDHLDECVDSVRMIVAGQAILRPDFDAAILAMRREFMEGIAAQNDARHAQTAVFNAHMLVIEERIAHRLDRLEDVYFNMNRAPAPAPQPGS